MVRPRSRKRKIDIRQDSLLKSIGLETKRWCITHSFNYSHQHQRSRSSDRGAVHISKRYFGPGTKRAQVPSVRSLGSTLAAMAGVPIGDVVAQGNRSSPSSSNATIASFPLTTPTYQTSNCPSEFTYRQRTVDNGTNNLQRTALFALSSVPWRYVPPHTTRSLKEDEDQFHHFSFVGK